MQDVHNSGYVQGGRGWGGVMSWNKKAAGIRRRNYWQKKNSGGERRLK